MTELALDSLTAWYDEKTKELLSTLSSEVGKRIKGVKTAASDIRLVLNEISNLKSSEGEELLRSALDKFVDKISSTVSGLQFPEEITYSAVREFESKLERSAAEIFEAGRRWIPRFRGRRYKSVIIELDKHFREFTKETQLLGDIIKKNSHLDAVERVRDDIRKLNEMVVRAPQLEDELEDQQKRLGAARTRVNRVETQLKEYKQRSGAHEKEKIDVELEGIRQSLASQLDLLRKSMMKIRELSEAGSVHVSPENISAIDLYSRDLLEAVNSEPDGCPGFRSLLIEMRKVLGSLGLEGSRERRTLKRIENLLQSDMVASSQKRVKDLLKRRGELAQTHQPGEEGRILAELEESRKLLRDEETRMHRLTDERDQSESKLKKNAKDITAEIVKLTGTKIRISLK